MKYTGQVASCPFCGNINLALEQVNVGPMTVVCKACGARGPQAPKKYVVESWNHRVQSGLNQITIQE